MAKKLTKEEFIEKCKLNNSHFENVEVVGEYNGMDNRIECRCKIHTDYTWFPIAKNLSVASGCAICHGNIKLNLGFVKSDFAKRGYELLETEYIGSDFPMKFRCPNHPNEEMYITWYRFKSGQGCKFCSGFKYTIEFIKQEFLRLANYVVLDDVYVNSNTPVRYICPHHPEEDKYMSWSNFQRGKRCRLCYIDGMKHPYEFVYNEYAKKGYKLLDETYIDSDKPMRYQCEKHPDKELKIRFADIQLGFGCPYCSGKNLTYEFVKNEFEKLGYTLLTDTFVDSHQKLEYICNKHPNHINFANYNYIQQGGRCPLCSETKGESRILEFLDKNNIKYKFQYKFDDCRNKNRLPFDFGILNENNELSYLIEYDGEGHYFPVKFCGMSEEKAKKVFERTKKHDEIKNTYCKNNNIKLIRIPYWDFKNIEDILNKELNIILKKGSDNYI